MIDIKILVHITQLAQIQIELTNNFNQLPNINKVELLQAHITQLVPFIAKLLNLSFNSYQT